MGMYRSQVFGPKEVGLHWQAHKHGADHADASSERMPVAICLGGPPEVMFSAISPLPDNLSEYEFAGLLGKRRLRITKCVTNDLLVPADCDVVIEGYMIPGETREEGPFGDHFGHYSLADQYPVMHIEAITHRKDAVVPMTNSGSPSNGRWIPGGGNRRCFPARIAVSAQGCPRSVSPFGDRFS